MSRGPKFRSEGPDGAPALVLLHSIGTSVELWTPCLGPLTEQLRVLRVNAPGHGGAPPAPAGDVAALGLDVLRVLDPLAIKRAHMAGLSLGGMTAMWLAIHHPERIGRLALLCTSAYLPPPQRWLDRAATVRSEGMAAIAGAVGTWLTETAARRDPELVARLRDLLTSADPESYAQCCEAIGTLDLRADLPRIAAPTLVIAGADDRAIPPPHGQAIAEAIPGARLEIVGPAAHQATFEQPGRIAALLLDHFHAAVPPPEPESKE